jgi:hypothetical protein
MLKWVVHIITLPPKVKSCPYAHHKDIREEEEG